MSRQSRSGRSSSRTERRNRLLDTGLAGTLVVAVINGCGRAAINVGDGLECLMGERQVAGGAGGVEDDYREVLIRGGTIREATRVGRRTEREGGRLGK